MGTVCTAVAGREAARHGAAAVGSLLPRRRRARRGPAGTPCRSCADRVKAPGERPRWLRCALTPLAAYGERRGSAVDVEREWLDLVAGGAGAAPAVPPPGRPPA